MPMGGAHTLGDDTYCLAFLGSGEGRHKTGKPGAYNQEV